MKAEAGFATNLCQMLPVTAESDAPGLAVSYTHKSIGPGQVAMAEAEIACTRWFDILCRC